MITNLDVEFKKAFGEQVYRELNLLIPEMRAFEKTVTPPSVLGDLIGRKLMDIDPERSPQEIKNLLKATFEGQLMFVQRWLETFSELLEEKGYKGTLEHFKDHVPSEELYVGNYPPFDYRFRNEYLWASTLALREGCIVAEKIEVDPKLLQKLRKLTDALDAAVEENYQGKEKEGLSLEEWYDRRSAK